MAFLLSGGAVWLFLATVPVFADGGPHVLTINNGSSGINADSCAGCHRLHTSQSASGFLLTAAGTVTNFCLSCHGTTVLGATTDVATGIQYTLAARDTALGALRGGGFVQARIDSGNATRTRFEIDGTLGFYAKVPVAAAPSTVTSAHLAVTGSPITATNKVWGNGAIGSVAGPTLSSAMTCGTCHNPHGNGNYRILEPIPSAAGMTAASTGVSVSDATYVAGRTRNYTVIQKAGVQGTESSFLLYADQVLGTYSASSGDYLRRSVPWNDPAGMFDAPNGLPQAEFPVVGFNKQMTAWCTQCHTRYYNADGPKVSTGDPIFKYQHVTNVDRVCTTCHVAHGSNAIMDPKATEGIGYSANLKNPDGTVSPNVSATSGDSRLLKVDNRGTCLLCHDPTKTVIVGTTNGPTPNPFVP